MARDGVDRVAQEIDGEHKNRDLTSPAFAPGQTERGRCASGADDEHKQNRQAAEGLKGSVGIGIESPHRFENAAREQQTNNS